MSTIKVTVVASQGPAGPPGPQGPAGDGGTPYDLEPPAIGTGAAGTAAEYARGDHTHDAPADMATDAELAGKSDVGHGHAQSDVTGLAASLAAKADDAATTTALAGKSDIGHAHVIADTTGLQAALDAKATTASLTAHTSDVANPHAVTAAQVGAATPAYVDAADASIPGVAVAASRTLIASDAGKWLECSSASPINLTVDGNVFTAGQVVFAEQVGAGLLTIVQGASMTLTKDAATLKAFAQSSVVGIRFKTATTATVFGALAAS